MTRSFSIGPLSRLIGSCRNALRSHVDHLRWIRPLSLRRRPRAGRIPSMQLEAFFERATQAFEVVGVSAMVVGAIFAFLLASVTWKRSSDRARAFKTLRDTLGGAILLGLELLVA